MRYFTPGAIVINAIPSLFRIDCVDFSELYNIAILEKGLNNKSSNKEKRKEAIEWIKSENIFDNALLLFLFLRSLKKSLRVFWKKI